jgi:hypothetical protein
MKNELYAVRHTPKSTTLFVSYEEVVAIEAAKAIKEERNYTKMYVVSIDIETKKEKSFRKVG